MEIHDYDYKINYNDLPKKRLFGIELEVAPKNIWEKYENDDYDYIGSKQNTKDLQKVVDSVSPLLKDWCILKRDGTIDSGFEIVTKPMTLEEHREKWNEELFEKLNDIGLISYNAKTAGHHCHVSRYGLSNLQIAKVLKFLHNKPNRIFLKKIAQREDKEYAEFSSKKNFGYVLQKGSKNKYDALNLGHKDTIEFRLFKGTLNHDAFHKNLEFCEAILNFCGPAKNSVDECLIWWNFIDFIKRDKNNYFYLLRYCTFKEMDSIDSWNQHVENIKRKKEQEKNNSVEVIT